MAQTLGEGKFIHYTTIKGLSDNYVTGIVQDDRGFMWVSTDNGLNRLDGKEINHLFQISGKQSLIKDKLTGLIGVGNELLVSSSRGAQWINVTNNQYTSLTVAKNQPGSTYQNAVYDAVITNDKICLITTHTGAYAFDSTGKLIFRFDHHKPDASGTVTGSRFGRALTVFDNYRVLHFDRDYNMSIYDSRNNTFKPIDAYKQSLPGLYAVKGSMPIRGRLTKDKIIFLNFHSNVLMAYDVKTDKVKIISRPGWAHKYIGWDSHWLTINDSTALLYGGTAGINTIHIDPLTLYTSCDSIPFFSKQVCTAAILDRDNRLWVGTSNGLFQQNIKEVALHAIKHPLFNSPGLDYPIAISSLLRKNDLLYVGSYSTLPIIIFDSNYALKKQISFSSLSSKCNQLWHIMDFKEDTLWFATQDGLVWYNEKNGNYARVHLPGLDSLIQHNAITLLYKDSKGIIWLQINWSGGLIMYNPFTQVSRRFQITDKSNYLPLRVVNFVTEDGEANVWFAENGLIRWNRKREIFDTLITSYAGFNKDNVKIKSLSNDEKGNIVFCNENNGVLQYTPRTKTYQQISVREGLQENAAIHGYPLSNQYLWVVTHNFITGIDQLSSKAISYSYSDSMPASLFRTIYHDHISKRMLFGFDNEFIWTEDRIEKHDTKPIPFYIDAIHIADEKTLLFPGENLSLSYGQNDLIIHCTALNFDAAESNRYAYRINGKEWITLGSENSIHFSNLSPGKYEVEVKYYAVSNPQSETIKKITLRLAPPFWNTWWFRTLIGAAIITIAYLLYKNRIHRIQAKARIDKQIAESEIKALRAQMNPHFIFNSLNSIMEMVLHDDKRNASRYLSNYAQLIRLNLEHSERRFISLKENIDYLKLYLELEQIRTDRFVFSIEVDEDIKIDETQLPPMLIQPFIENAIWYGPSPTQIMKLNIRFLKKSNQLLCIIEDNGVGIETSLKNKNQNITAHNPMGIGNVRQRVRILNEKYNWNCTLLVEDKGQGSLTGDTGTIVTLGLPLNLSEL